MSYSLEVLDHFVLTVNNLDASIAFYRDTLGITVECSAQGRIALRIGGQKINLHQKGSEFAPHAASPCPGSGDFCCLTSTPLEQVAAELTRKGVTICEGPVARTGSLGPLRSLYLRDPDGTLIEIANQLEG